MAEAGAEFVRLPLQAKDPVSLATNAVRLARFIRREKVSLVHVRSRAPAFSALIAARTAGVSLVATYHGAYSASWVGKRWYNRIMTSGDAVIAHSRFIAEHVAAEHPDASAKVVLIPEGVDFARFDPAVVTGARVDAVRASWGVGDARVLLVAARLAPTKGQLLALAAVAQLAVEPAPVLVLVGAEGRPGYRAAIAAAAERLGLGERIRLAGACSDMPAAYLAADIVLAPSSVPESFGRAAVEAAAMTRPVIASALGAFSETIVHGETGWLAPAGDAVAWSEALRQALTAPPRRLSEMGQTARERARRLYSLAAMCEATFALYRRVLEGRE